MIVVADSGSTKTDWKVASENHDSLSFRSIGFNPFFVDAEIISDEIRKSLPADFVPEFVAKVFFYGAGCSSEERNNRVKDGIRKVFSNAEIFVSHDLLGAARALFRTGKGIAAILGTGSNTCYYDGKEIIRNVTSMGYILGDEGSGAYIGKKFVSAVIMEEFPAVIREKFQSAFGLSKDDLLTAVYSKPFPNRFLASFCPFLAANISDQSIRQMLTDSFNEFFEKQICRYENYKTSEVRCVGSVAWYFRDILSEVAAKRGVTVSLILENPLDELMVYHQK